MISVPFQRYRNITNHDMGETEEHQTRRQDAAILKIILFIQVEYQPDYPQ